MSSVGFSECLQKSVFSINMHESLKIFSGFLFATAKVAYVTAMLILHLILHSASSHNDFHIFITSSTRFSHHWRVPFDPSHQNDVLYNRVYLTLSGLEIRKGLFCSGFNQVLTFAFRGRLIYGRLNQRARFVIAFKRDLVWMGYKITYLVKKLILQYQRRVDVVK